MEVKLRIGAAEDEERVRCLQAIRKDGLVPDALSPLDDRLAAYLDELKIPKGVQMTIEWAAQQVLRGMHVSQLGPRGSTGPPVTQ